MGEFAFARPDFFGPPWHYRVKLYAMGTAAMIGLWTFILGMAYLVRPPEWVHPAFIFGSLVALAAIAARSRSSRR